MVERLRNKFFDGCDNAEACVEEILENVLFCTARHDALVQCIQVPRRLFKLDWKQFLAVTQRLAQTTGRGKYVVYDRGNVYPHQILALAASIAVVKRPENVVGILDRFIDIYREVGIVRWNNLAPRAGFKFRNGQNCSVAEFRAFVAVTGKLAATVIVSGPAEVNDGFAVAGVTLEGLEWFWQPRRGRRSPGLKISNKLGRREEWS